MPSSCSSRHLAEKAALEAVLAVEVVDLRRDLLLAPLPHRRDERLVLVAQRKVDHVSSPSVVVGPVGEVDAILEPGPRGQDPSPLVRIGGGHEDAHHREAADARQRLLPVALVDHPRLETGLAQAQSGQLGLVDLARLENDVPVAVRALRLRAHRSFQAGLRFSDTARRPSSTSWVPSSWLR